MLFGTQYGSGFGDPDRMVDVLNVALAPHGAAVVVRWSPATGFAGAFWGLYVNATLAREEYIADADPTYERSLPLPVGATSISVVLLRHGHASWLQKRAARILDGSDARQITANWDWPIEILPLMQADGIAYGHDTGWSLTGLDAFRLDASVFSTRKSLTVDVTVTMGTALAELYQSNVLVASGSVVVPGSVTLTEQNDSGIGGSVILDASTTTKADMMLQLRFPESMRVYVGTTSPPIPLAASVLFNGRMSAGWASTPKAAGTYYLKLVPIGDTGVDGTASAIKTIVIGAPPAAATNLRYTSGAAAATVIFWDYGSTVGITFDAYVQKIGDAFLDVDNAAAMVTNAKTLTLPAQVGYPGTIRVIVRATVGGIQEKNANALEIEYDGSGVRVPGRPNACGIGDVDVAGLGLSVRAVYDSTGEAGTATAAQLFIRDSAGSYNFSSPDGTAALTAGSATVTATGTEGWRYVCLKAATAGGMQSADASAEVLVWLSADVGAAPAIVAAVVNRG